jgi:formylglycine-generating enzyme required for sulfatase activity
LEVTGGTYDRTYDPLDAGVPALAADGGPIDEVDPASVSSFQLDKYVVTVGRFRQYVNYLASSAGVPPSPGSGIHTHLNAGRGLTYSASPTTYETGWDATNWNQYIATGQGAASAWTANLASCNAIGDGEADDPSQIWSSWTAIPGAQENLPINCVTWYEAYAFCIWDGGFLPSEAEWEYAAAGGSQQREYPWGSTEPGTENKYAIYGDNIGDCYYPSGTLMPCTGVVNIAPVGTPSLGAGFWGQLDMAGEVAQWTLDWFAPNYVDTYVIPCVDCANLSLDPVDRVIRGGVGPLWQLLPTDRYGLSPSNRDSFAGLRCARIP